MLAGEQQAAVTVAVEGLMEARPVPELEAFATYDPKVPLTKLVGRACLLVLLCRANSINFFHDFCHILPSYLVSDTRVPHCLHNKL
jgi:hypothetical protein